MGEIKTLNTNTHQPFVMSKDTELVGVEYLTYSLLYDNIFFSGYNNGNLGVNVIDDSGSLSCTHYSIHENKITQILSSKLNENLLVSLSLDQNLCLFDLNSGSVVNELQLSFPVLSGDLNEADYSIVIGGVKGNMFKYDLRNLNKPLLSFKGHMNEDVLDVSYNKRYVNKKIKSEIGPSFSFDKIVSKKDYKKSSNFNQNRKISKKIENLEKEFGDVTTKSAKVSLLNFRKRKRIFKKIRNPKLIRTPNLKRIKKRNHRQLSLKQQRTPKMLFMKRNQRYLLLQL
jgi:WD40 repeat protein